MVTELPFLTAVSPETVPNILMFRKGEPAVRGDQADGSKGTPFLHYPPGENVGPRRTAVLDPQHPHFKLIPGFLKSWF